MVSDDRSVLVKFFFGKKYAFMLSGPPSEVPRQPPQIFFDPPPVVSGSSRVVVHWHGRPHHNRFRAVASYRRALIRLPTVGLPIAISAPLGSLLDADDGARLAGVPVVHSHPTRDATG